MEVLLEDIKLYGICIFKKDSVKLIVELEGVVEKFKLNLLLYLVIFGRYVFILKIF